MIYVVKCTVKGYDKTPVKRGVKKVVKRTDQVDNRRLIIYCSLFDQTFVWKNSDILRYGNYSAIVHGMVLVDNALAAEYPNILSSV